MDFLRRLFGFAPPVPSPAHATPSLPKRPPLPPAGEAEAIVRLICDQAHAGDGNSPLGRSARWEALKSEPLDLQIAVMLAAAIPLPGRNHTNAYWIVRYRDTIVAQGLRRALPLREEHLTHLMLHWAQQRQLEGGLPGRAILAAVEKIAAASPLSAETRQVLANLQQKAGRRRYDLPQDKFHTEIGQRVQRLLNPLQATGPDLPTGAFADGLQPWLNGLTEERRHLWLKLLGLAVEAGDKAKPSTKWLTVAQEAVASLGADDVTVQITHWLEATTPNPAVIDLSVDILKGLIWASARLDHAAMAGPLGRFCEKCFRKVPQIGARSVKLGNASLWALSEMAGEPRAAAELIRLRDKIKYPSACKVIDNRLGELASKSGQTVAALEDLSLPDFGLSRDGTASQSFGEARAELALSATELAVTWFNAAGVALKSIPAQVRDGHAADLAAFRQRGKDIEAARTAQALRLEQSWVEDRDWAYGDWVASFLDHPLRRPIIRALVWRVDDGDDVYSAMPGDNGIIDGKGALRTPSQAARIRLWHPLDSTPAEVLAWRRHIVERGLTQPIKQAHREVYVLTDAERATRVYSNRFAAHILRQHQFRALCQARGWAYGLMGGWDGWNVPERQLPKVGLRVQYQVEVVDGGTSNSGVALHLSSDQVRFLDHHGHPLELDTVPPIIFSEAFRDVDLFVAVASVANDPGWTDGGPEGRFGGYWRDWAFGDLGESATTRKELIAALAPRLSIRDQLEVGEKSLLVQGKRHRYAIHFGSGNIQILPDNRYLCIVPDGAPKEATGLKLPFTGDGLLSIILAKAFLLADESKIRDLTILSQL